MASPTNFCYFAMTLLALSYSSDALGLQKCVPLQKGPFSKCTSAGYNYTFPFPSGLSNRSLTLITSIVKTYMTTIQNCSVGAIGETMACAFLAPYCKESNSQPFLPCKRVCSEFLKRCGSSLTDYIVDIMLGLCSMLPNGTAKDGSCYEPENFHVHYNSTRKGPLERGCSPVIIPICQNVGYTHTIITQKRQKRFYKYWYRKNYTNSAVVSIPRQNSWAQDLMTNKKMNRCAQNVKKLFCVEHIPPCFPEEGIAYYTACRDLCKNVTIECPEVLRTRMRSYFLYCEKLAFGEAYKGFCKHRSWPPPMKWLDFFKADRKSRPPNTPSKPPSGVGGGAIAAIIVVPVIIVGIIIAMVFFYKKRKFPSQGYARQQDDKIELVDT